MEDIAQWIIGTWRLIHSIRIDADGNKMHVYGKDAVGYIHYSDSGIMSVQICRKDRVEMEDVAELKQDYLAYFGRYEVDTKREVVRHFIEGQLFPGERPAVLERRYRFEGDLMALTPVDAPQREILWRRVSKEL